MFLRVRPKTLKNIFSFLPSRLEEGRGGTSRRDASCTQHQLRRSSISSVAAAAAGDGSVLYLVSRDHERSTGLLCGNRTPQALWTHTIMYKRGYDNTRNFALYCFIIVLLHYSCMMYFVFCILNYIIIIGILYIYIIVQNTSISTYKYNNNN